MAVSNLERLMSLLDEVYLYRDSDPRRARYLRGVLYQTALELIAVDNSSTSRDKMISYAQTALEATQIDIAPIPRAGVR